MVVPVLQDHRQLGRPSADRPIRNRFGSAQSGSHVLDLTELRWIVDIELLKAADCAVPHSFAEFRVPKKAAQT